MRGSSTKSRFVLQLALACVLASGLSAGAESANDDAAAQPDVRKADQIGFTSPGSVEGQLAETAGKQKEGLLARFAERKQRLEASTGLTYGFDINTQYLGTDSDRSPSDAAGNVLRFYGTWTATGRGTRDTGALVFKVEDRSATGGNIPPQALGPSLGYAGLFSSTYSDAGLVLTNLYWRQRFAGGRAGFVVGQVDASDYVNPNSVASPWTAFTNLAFEQQTTLAVPSQGLGAALQWRIDDNWAILGGFADANGDPSDPLDSAEGLFDSWETFKHVAVGWTPDWGDRFDQSLQLTVWQVDERKEAGVEGGHGVAFAASGRKDNWQPFVRAGYAKDAGTALDRAISVGTGYDARGGEDLAGIGVSWGRAPDDSRDQFTLEAFYRYDLADFVQLTPEIQYVIHPANDAETDDILVLGARLRVFF